MDLKQHKNERIIGRKGRNKRHFCIYTPEKSSNEIADITLSLYFKDEINLEAGILPDLDTLEKLKSIKAIDLSCGDGAILIPFIIKILELSKKICGEYQFLPSWISGYDIDEEAIKKLKNKIYEVLKSYNIENAKEILEKINLKTTDSLICCEEKYNIILGNPPYFGEKNHKEIFNRVRETEFGKIFYEAKMDYLYFFIEKGIELLEPGGVLTYITTNYWFKADSGKKLRNFIRESTEIRYVNDINTSVFQYAPGQHNAIFSLKKRESGSGSCNENIKGKKVIVFNENRELAIPCDKIYDAEEKICFGTEEEFEFSKKIFQKKSFFLEDYFEINQGMVSGLDEAFVFSEYKEDLSDYLKPFYKNKDINKYSVKKENQFWIIYNCEKNSISEVLENHLIKYEDKLKNRREVKNKSKNWWELTWKRREEIFTTPSIVVRQRCKENLFAYTDGGFYGSADVYYITPKTDDINLFYILGYLNSSLFFRWYKMNGKYKGINLEFYSTPLKRVPIIYPKNSDDIENISTLVKKQISEYNDRIQDEINEYFNCLIQ